MIARRFILAGAAFLACSAPAFAQLQIESKDGKASMKLGFLLQAQGEALEMPDGEGTSQNLFLRRFRILFGGKVAEKWLFFFETDSPNIGKTDPDTEANPTGAKGSSDVYIQDAFLTYDHADAFKVDAGMMLFPLSHNHIQSAATLLPVDYGPYSFLESTAAGERVGRDYGVQVRGYPFGKKLEYRLGVFQGVRGPGAQNAFRTSGRLVWYPFEAETGFFYGGTYQGTKKILAIGASYDVQKDYALYGADVFWDWPIAGGQQGITIQADYTSIDGGTFMTSLAKQTAGLVELGYHFGKGRFSPFVQYAARDFDDAATADQDVAGVGFAWWMKGHQRSLKASAARISTDGLPDRNQFLIQLQLFQF